MNGLVVVREGVEDSDFDRVFASFETAAEIKLPWWGNTHAHLFAIDADFRGGDDLAEVEGGDLLHFLRAEGDASSDTSPPPE